MTRDNKYRQISDLLYRYIMLSLLDGVSFKELLSNRGYKSVVLYGYTRFCEIILHELNSSDIIIKYVLDRRAEEVDINFPVYSLDEVRGKNCDLVDAVIICLSTYDDNLRREIKDVLKTQEIVDVEEILYEI